jgi:stage III sporulation protein AH
MNTRRQTIWLVSMLSLMVVLSAYYLFTDNIDELDVASENEEVNHTVIDAVEVDEHSDLTELDELLASAGQLDGTSPSAESKSDKGTDEGLVTINDSDKKTLQKVQAGAQSGEEVLASIDMKRTQALQKETEQLMEIALDPKKTVDEVASAENRLQMIEETQAKVSDLEDQLMREYENVIITEDKGKWNVIIQADKLQRSEAVTIIDMVNEQLQVSPSKIAVEFVS